MQVFLKNDRNTDLGGAEIEISMYNSENLLCNELPTIESGLTLLALFDSTGNFFGRIFLNDIINQKVSC